MSPTTIRILIAIFLIAHAWIHVSLTYVPTPQPGAIHTPFWPSWWRDATDSAWLASRLGLPSTAVRAIGSALWLATAAGFVLAGFGLFGVPGLAAIWPAAAIGGSAASLLLLGFYWHPWLVMGVVINLAVLASLWLRWPTAIFHAQ